jgi:hypothetical protein
MTDLERLVMQMPFVASRERIVTFAAKRGRNERPISSRGGRVIRLIPFARSARL